LAWREPVPRRFDVSTFTKETRIDAPRAEVWRVLADLASIEKWNPGVVKSYSTSDHPGGEGATRHCDVTGMGGKTAFLEERAFDWREGEGFKIDIYETNLPIKSNVLTFTVADDGDATLVKISPDYKLKFGLIGAMMDKLMVRGRFEQGMEDMAAGLKRYVESGAETSESEPAGV